MTMSEQIRRIIDTRQTNSSAFSSSLPAGSTGGEGPSLLADSGSKAHSGSMVRTVVPMMLDDCRLGPEET